MIFRCCHCALSINREISHGLLGAVTTLGGTVRGACLSFSHAPWAPQEELGVSGSGLSGNAPEAV